MISGRIERNKSFLRNLYRAGPYDGHGLVCTPKAISIHEHPDYDFTVSSKPIEGWVEWVVENFRRQVAFHETLDDHSVPCARLSTGTHIYAAAFGCDVHCATNDNAFATPLLSSAREADQLQTPDIWNSPGLNRIFELAHAVEKKLGKEVALGPPDMQSGFDTAALIWHKEDLYCAMLDPQQKPAVKRLVRKCAALFNAFLLAFRKEFPQCNPCHCPRVWAPPEMGPWVSNDECGAFGVEHFEEYCLPELVDLSETFGGIGMHCCADAEHQFESFQKIPRFYAFNRVKAKRGYLPLLEHFQGVEAPVHVLANLDDKEVRGLLAGAAPGTRFIFNYYAEGASDARDWLDRMRNLDRLCFYRAG